MSDWFEDGLRRLQAELAEETGITLEYAVAAYGFLSEVGLIDYDVEKEVISERYGDEDD